jgi:hypothetical protein
MARCGKKTTNYAFFRLPPPQRANWRIGNLWSIPREITRVLGSNPRYGALWSVLDADERIRRKSGLVTSPKRIHPLEWLCKKPFSPTLTQLSFYHI